MPPRIARRRLRRKRVFKKRFQRAGRWISSRVPKVHRMKEMYNFNGKTPVGDANIVPVQAFANATSSGIIAVRAGSLTNWNSMELLFDLYKITGYKVKMVPRWNTSDVQNSEFTARLPTLYIAPNRDPYVPKPASIDDILNDDMCKVIRLDKPVSFYMKSPKPALLSQPTSEADAPQLMPLQFNVGSKYQPWLTTGGNNQYSDQSLINHYGFRWYLDNTVNSCGITVDTYITLYLTFKEQD